MKAEPILFCCGQQEGIAICGVWHDTNMDMGLVSQSCKIFYVTSDMVLQLKHLCSLEIRLLIL